MFAEYIIGNKQHLLYCLLPPTAITGIHPLAQFFLFGVFVVVFLDGPGTVAGHVKSILSENILTLIF